MVTIVCLVCQTPTQKKPSHVLSGRAKFCSKSCKGKYRAPNLVGSGNPFFGRKHSEASKRVMSEKKRGKRSSPETEFKKGHVPASWKGGRYNYLVAKCLERDNSTCRVCGLRDLEIMQVDHVKPRVLFPELYNSLENLQTLCPNCHERKSRVEKGIRPARPL